jgi:hypothetical protein
MKSDGDIFKQVTLNRGRPILTASELGRELLRVRD